VWINGNWRMTFTFENGDAILVDYQKEEKGPWSKFP
jgi:plasmid maintenance system killer protein